MFESITGMLPTLQDCVLKQMDETKLDTDGLPFVSCGFGLYYNWFLTDFGYLMEKFEEAHPDFDAKHPERYLDKAGIDLTARAIREADVSGLDGYTVLSLLEGIVVVRKKQKDNNARAFEDPDIEYDFSDPMLDVFRTRAIERWLLRLKEIDEAKGDPV